MINEMVIELIESPEDSAEWLWSKQLGEGSQPNT